MRRERHPDCADGCRYAADVAMPEHQCVGGCQYAEREEYPGQAPCPHCFESSGYMARTVSATWYEPAYDESDPTRRCPTCEGTGTVEAPLATLDDLDELAFEEAEGRTPTST